LFPELLDSDTDAAPVLNDEDCDFDSLTAAAPMAVSNEIAPAPVSCDVVANACLPALNKRGPSADALRKADDRQTRKRPTAPVSRTPAVPNVISVYERRKLRLYKLLRVATFLDPFTYRGIITNNCNDSHILAMKANSEQYNNVKLIITRDLTFELNAGRPISSTAIAETADGADKRQRQLIDSYSSMFGARASAAQESARTMNLTANDLSADVVIATEMAIYESMVAKLQAQGIDGASFNVFDFWEGQKKDLPNLYTMAMTYVDVR